MITSSALFQQAVLSSYTSVAVALLANTQLLVGLADNTNGTQLKIKSGTVTLDGTAQIRGTLSLVIAAGWPAGIDPTKECLPYGSEIFVSRGVRYGNGNVERVQLGVFRVDTIEETGYGELTITAYDRTKVISEAQLLSPASYDVTWRAGNAVKDILGDIWPGGDLVAMPVWDDTTAQNSFLPRVASEQTDRLQLINDIVGQLGKFFYFDNQGQSRVDTLPNFNTLTPVWAANARINRKPGTLLSTDRLANRAVVANACVVQGAGLDGTPPVTGYAYDNNPASPTYFYGPFGQLPVFVQTQLTAQADVNALAITSLAAVVGLPMSIDFTTLVNPTLEPNDAVTITPLPDPYSNPAGTGTSEVHVITAIQIPLEPTGVMQCHTRLQSPAILTNGHP